MHAADEAAIRAVVADRWMAGWNTRWAACARDFSCLLPRSIVGNSLTTPASNFESCNTSVSFGSASCRRLCASYALARSSGPQWKRIAAKFFYCRETLKMRSSCPRPRDTLEKLVATAVVHNRCIIWALFLRLYPISSSVEWAK
jgi:hypothetical protein